MKKILITGANSYVGTNVEKWLMKEPDKYCVETLDMKDPNWKDFDFSRFDVVFHVAGIAHVSRKKGLKDKYYEVNRDLAIKTANRSRTMGVKLFVFMSSIIIYGKDNLISDFTPVNINQFNPDNSYGGSKLEADLKIQQLANNQFKTAIIRTPMIYGPNCKGNFPKLIKIAKYIPIYPKIENYRSMIFIDNLAMYIKNIIDTNSYGIFYPQNTDYISTNEIIKNVRKILGKSYRETRMFNFMIYPLSYLFPFINKIYGNKYYDKNVITFNDAFVNNCESIKRSIQSKTKG